MPHLNRLTRSLPRRACLLLLAAWSGACVDVGDFVGHWEGVIAADPTIRRGFPGETRLEAELESVDLLEIGGTFSTSDGRFENARLQAIELAAGDALSDLTFGGDPLRTYLLFAEPKGMPAGEAAWIVLSLFPDEHVELRIMRRNDLFGVFTLRRR